ncbi:MAG: ferrochelatase [Gammaproteobacteria bacterium]|nr:ferrochelatase [Gammaproteobacteria bacterium]
MPHYLGTSHHQHEQQGTTGILLINLGTPDKPEPAAIRRYLAEFLSDPRVIEYPRWLWKLILHGIILRIRPGKIAHAYQSIWTENGSPLMHFTRRQTEMLNQSLASRAKAKLHVVFGMRYGKPSIATALRTLHSSNIERLLILPLYPQYSATTSASSFDAVAKELVSWRRIPSLKMIMQYHDHPAYIEALANSITRFRQTNGSADILLFSFHGLPKRYLLAGDPYFCQCHKTARLVAEHLGFSDTQWQISFQSRVGKEEWLKPYTDKLLLELAQQSRSVQIICPGFSSDCLETIEEINIQNRALFLEHGGTGYDYIPALNDSPEHIEFLSQLLCDEAGEWFTVEEEDATLRAIRAKQQGAKF